MTDSVKCRRKDKDLKGRSKEQEGYFCVEVL